MQATVKRLLSKTQRAGVSQTTQPIADGGSRVVELGDPFVLRTKRRVAGVLTVAKKTMSAER